MYLPVRSSSLQQYIIFGRQRKYIDPSCNIGFQRIGA
jgi:hypothetical protein